MQRSAKLRKCSSVLVPEEICSASDAKGTHEGCAAIPMREGLEDAGTTFANGPRLSVETAQYSPSICRMSSLCTSLVQAAVDRWKPSKEHMNPRWEQWLLLSSTLMASSIGTQCEKAVCRRLRLSLAHMWASSRINRNWLLGLLASQSQVLRKMDRSIGRSNIYASIE